MPVPPIKSRPIVVPEGGVSKRLQLADATLCVSENGFVMPRKAFAPGFAVPDAKVAVPGKEATVNESAGTVRLNGIVALALVKPSGPVVLLKTSTSAVSEPVIVMVIPVRTAVGILNVGNVNVSLKAVCVDGVVWEYEMIESALAKPQAATNIAVPVKILRRCVIF